MRVLRTISAVGALALRFARELVEYPVTEEDKEIARRYPDLEFARELVECPVTEENREITRKYPD